MTRVLVSLLFVSAPLLLLLASTGCEPETKSVQKTERVEESEPQMVSPGEPVVE